MEKEFMKYTDQLRHPLWQKKRLEVMAAHNFQCEQCGENEITLNVHHKRYDKDLRAWEYPISDYACLCEFCHKGENCCVQDLYMVTYDHETKMKYLAPIESKFCTFCGKQIGAQ